jgi:hypothetical protein
MPFNIDVVFIRRALEVIEKKLHTLSDEQKEALCDDLIDLVNKYLPGNLKKP